MKLKSYISAYSHIVFILLFLLLPSCKNETTINKKYTYVTKNSSLDQLIHKYRFSTDSLNSLLKNYHWNTAALYKINYELGRSFRKKLDYTKAVQHHQKALDFAKELKDTVKIVTASNQLGTNYRRLGSLADAVKHHLFSLKIAERYSQKNTKYGKKLLSFSLNGVGNVYKNMGNGVEAYHYFKRSLALDKDLKNYLGMAMNYVTIGSIKEHEEKLDSAYFYYQRAMHCDSLIKSKVGIAICHNRIGQLMSKKEKWNEALHHYQSAKYLLTEKKDAWNRMKAENEIAWIYIKQKKYKKALDILKRIEKIEKERKMYGYLAQTQVLLASLYSDMNNYKESSNAYKKYVDTEELIRKMNNSQKVSNIQVKFEREMSNHEIQNLNKINTKEKNQKRQIIISSTIIFVLLLFLLLMTYLLFTSQRKRNKTLRKANKIRDKLFSIISHDLKAPTIAQKIAIENISSQMESIDNDGLKSFYNVLRENTENQITVIENLMHWTKLQGDRIKYNPQAINLVAILKNEMKLYCISASQKSIVWKKELLSTCIVYADRQMISIVVRNLINNAVKFTDEGGTISIACTCDGEVAKVSIIDSGVGMTKEQLASFYAENENIEVKFGTKGEKGTGLGLVLCKDLLSRNNSQLKVESEVGKGTKIEFELKKA